MHWSFQPVGGFWFTTIVVAVMLALVVVVPRPRPAGRKLWTLRGLRLAIVLLVLTALARPTLVRTVTKPLEAALLLLVDVSRSMQVADSLAGGARWEATKRMLGDSTQSLAELDERWDVRAYQFGTSVGELEINEGRIALPRAPLGETTAIGAALDDLLDREGGQRLLGIVLLSDGASRSLPPRDMAPQMAVRRLAAENVPLFTATFGQPGSSDRADLAIEDLTVSESAFVKAPTEVAALMRLSGYANRQLTVQLLWEDTDGEMQVVDSQKVDGQRIESGPQGGVAPIRLEHTPLEPGEQKLTVRVAPEEGELITSNNEQSTFITVRDGGVKVLYLVGAKQTGGTPGLEQRYVRAALAASPDIVVTRRVFDYRRLRADLRLDEDRGAPDVILIDDLDASALNTQAWRNVAQLVRDGAGLGMIGGHHSFGPGGYLNSPLSNILPIQIGPAERQRLDEPIRKDVHLPGPLRMQPTEPLGAGHPILKLGAQERATTAPNLWTELPELDGANRFDRLKPNAMVLAETAGANPRPLLVVGQSSVGRVMALATDSTWRWRLEGFHEPHRRFWRQAILWLARKDDSSQNPVWIKLDSRRVARGARLDMQMGVRRVADDAEIRYVATVLTPEGKPIDLATAIGVQTSTLFAATTTPGDYTARVTAFDGETELGTAEARFSVPDQDLELDNPAAEPTLMAQLAAATSVAGGRAIAPEELPDLLEEFAQKQPELEEEIIARITYWDTWPFFLLLVGLLGVEWYLRKRWGLV